MTYGMDCENGTPDEIKALSAALSEMQGCLGLGKHSIDKEYLETINFINTSRKEFNQFRNKRR